MRILLVNAPPKRKYGVVGQIYPPLGILYLISYVQKYSSHKYEFKAIDGYQSSPEAIIREVEQFKPEIMGLSYTTQAATGAYDLIKEVKNLNKHILVVSGGPHPTIDPREPFIKSLNDVVVCGEGEMTFLELIEKFRNKEAINNLHGIAYRNDSDEIQINAPRPLIENLDDIPFPAREYIDITKYPGYHYKKREKDTSILSARGCPYNCVYCSNPVWKLQKPWYRKRSPKNYVDEIEQVIEVYNIHELYDETDEFNANLGWAKAVCDEISARKIDISWKVQMRADHVDEELAQKMSQSGCWLAFFGVETGNEKTSFGVKKKITTQQVEKSLAIMKKFKIKTFALLMAFNAWEEDGQLCYEGVDETNNTLKFVKRLIREKKVDLMSWSLTTPYPGSELYEIAQKHQLIAADKIGRWELWDSSSSLLMNLPGVTEKDWLKVQRKGKMLQAYLLFKSGTFNIRSVNTYLKKALFLFKR